MAQSQNGNIPTYDVVVIGAGLTGLLSIYHLRNFRSQTGILDICSSTKYLRLRRHRRMPVP